MNSYEQKLERRRQRLRKRAVRLREKSAAHYEAARGIQSFIPMGQPILVGHHSEKRHRRDLEKIDRNYRASFEAQKAAEQADSRADSVGSAGISSDDPEAIQKLKAKLAKAETDHANERRWNAQWRKGGADALDAPDDVKAKILHTMKCCTHLREPFLLSLNTANIRRIKDRIAYLEKMATRPEMRKECAGGLVISENADLNRLQMRFPGKPPAEVIKALKSHGFRWSPSEGAWQRQRGNSATWAAQSVQKIWEAQLSHV